MKGTPVGTAARNRRRLAGAGLAVGVGLAISAAHAEADTIEVTSIKADAKHGFLAAVERAEATKATDQIVFAKNLRGTIHLNRNLAIKQPLAIIGRGFGSRKHKTFNRVVVAGPSQGMYVESSAKLAIREMSFDGISIDSEEASLTVKQSTLTGAPGSEKTGVATTYGYTHRPLLIKGSTISGFETGVQGYRSDGRIDASAITGNKGGGGVSFGGYSHLDLTNSTISGNSTDGGENFPAFGGGVRVGYESGGTITNSTITGNVATGANGTGGGVGGRIEINESTIADNSAAQGGGITGYYGPPKVENSVIADNTSTIPGQPGTDCAIGPRPEFDSFTSLGHNLIENPGDCASSSSDLVGVDPGLRQLADNGGPAPTMALGPGSPALGFARRNSATKFDERGAARDGKPDAGAFEVGKPKR